MAKKKPVPAECESKEAKQQRCLACGRLITANYQVPCCLTCREYSELYNWAAAWAARAEAAQKAGIPAPPVPPKPPCQRFLFGGK